LTLVLISYIEIWKKFFLPKLFLFRKRENSHYFLKLNIHFHGQFTFFHILREIVTACVRIFVYIYVYSCTGKSRTYYCASKCMHVCMHVRNRFLILIISFSVVVFVIDDKNAAFSVTLFSLKITYKWWEKKMMIRRSRWKWAMMYVCTYTSLAFVFRLQCALLSLSLFLSLFFVFKKLRVHKRIICAIDARIPPCSSSSLPDVFYNHTNTTCRCAHRKKTNREKERTKDAKKLSMNVYNEDEEKNVAPNVVFLSCYRIRENEDVKKDVFFFFCLIYTCPSLSNIHS
jgi:hypothetical protein